MAAPQKKRVHNFKYQKLSDFKTIQVHGVYGGMNLRGQLNMNFYVEAGDLAKTSSSQITNNKLETEVFPVASLTEQSSIRELHFGVNIDIAIVKSTAQWMLKHVNDYETKVKEIETNNSSLIQTNNNADLTDND